MSRLYGRKGFTRKTSIRRLLEPYEHPSLDAQRAADIVDLPADVAEALLILLPPAQLEDRVRDGAPTLQELVEISTRLDGAVLSGFRIEPSRLDERITLTTVTIPHSMINHERVSHLVEAAAPSPIDVGTDGSVYVDWS